MFISVCLWCHSFFSCTRVYQHLWAFAQWRNNLLVWLSFLFPRVCVSAVVVVRLTQRRRSGAAMLEVEQRSTALAAPWAASSAQAIAESPECKFCKDVPPPFRLSLHKVLVTSDIPHLLIRPNTFSKAAVFLLWSRPTTQHLPSQAAARIWWSDVCQVLRTKPNAQ